MGDPIRIVVLDRGWVFVGRVCHLEGGQVRIEQAACIRYWGTTKGLGQLRSGPLSGTRLDQAGTLWVPERAVIFEIDAEEAAWTRALSEC